MAQTSQEQARMAEVEAPDLARRLRDLGSGDVAQVGGKNASLGEMIRELSKEGIAIPPGFATTATAYWLFVESNELRGRIAEELGKFEKDADALPDVGEAIRTMFREAETPPALAQAIREQYQELSAERGEEELAVAVRSSATAEDLPEASFAGQQETFLNIRGEDALLDACKRCYASLFTDRAISYRTENGFDHMKVALSVGVQAMVRADTGGAGVLFTIDTETGFPNVIVINSAWGLGETVVGGEVRPDEQMVFKPLLEDEALTPIISRRKGRKQVKNVYTDDVENPTENVETSEEERRAWVLNDDEILQLARWGAVIERHYDKPMDVEWAKDGESGELFIVQARPETVQSQRKAGVMRTYSLNEKSDVLAEGLAVGDAIASGTVRVLSDPSEGDSFEDGQVLVASVTDPDWGPIMERASAVVTDHGGRTAHAAIVSRELGIPAIVGAGDATTKLPDGQAVTISCAEGEKGFIYEGELDFDADEIDLSDLPETTTPILMNIASPRGAFRWHQLPCQGIGLARMEFIIANVIRVHPMALVRFDELGDDEDDDEARKRIQSLTADYDDKSEYFVDHLAQGMAQIAASRYPDPVIIRTSDFKTNEYATLIGGRRFEPEEENPMIGVRGAARYSSEIYREGFALECRAIRRVRETMGLDNLVVMIPFCRTLEEADRVLKVLADEGLSRGLKGLKIYVMAEIPSNVALAREFAERFDGFSIGSNDLTQLVLGIDRDSEELSEQFDERNEAVTRVIRQLIEAAHEAETPVGICGQAPSDHPDFAEFLVEAGIDTISVNPDSVVDVIRTVSSMERR